VNMVQTRPQTNGEPLQAKPAGVRTLMPTTWLQHELRIEYRNGDGKAARSSGNLLDWCPAGVILNCDGVRTIFAWDRIVTYELKED
jgi:hypothetical protein